MATAKSLEPLIYPAFVRGNLTLIIGEAGVSKSTLIAGLCNAVTKGEEFLGFVPVVDNLKAVIFDLESSSPLIRERYVEVLQEEPSPNVWTCNETVTWKEAQNELMSLVREEGVNLIILDHLFLAFPHEDMSSATEALQVMSEQRAFAKTFNVCIVSLLHPPIEQRGGIYKGFGSIYKTNSVDVQINLTPDTVLKDVVELEVVKDRCYNHRMHFRFRKSEGKFTKIEDMTKQPEQYLSKSEACRKAILALTSSEDHSTSFYLDQLQPQFKENMIKVELSHLVEQGAIKKVRQGIYKAVAIEEQHGWE